MTLVTGNRNGKKKLSKQTTYKDTGVDIEKAEASLDRLKTTITETYTPQVLSGVGLFGGFYDLSEHGLEKPVLVSSTDGVGTKLKVAMLANRHHTVGRDLVNHCINDIAVCGAKPLFFLDYFASGSLEPKVYEEVVSGLAAGCKEAGIPLIGGETAEMPDFYQPGDYDMCGTIVGMVDKSKIITGKNIQPGDVLIGVASNGLHTNGYTLARHVLLENYDLNEKLSGLSGSLADELLRIHMNYQPLISKITAQLPVHGISHVTGGGIVKNTRRLLQKGLHLDIDWNSWEMPPIFQIIQKTGNVPVEDMRQTFNLGIGLIFIVSPTQKDALLEIGNETGHELAVIGSVSG